MRFRKTSNYNRQTYKWYARTDEGNIYIVYEFVPEKSNEKENAILRELHRMDDAWVESNCRNHNIWLNEFIRAQNEKWIQKRMDKFEKENGCTMEKKDAYKELQKVSPKWILYADKGSLDDGKPIIVQQKKSVLPLEIRLRMKEVIALLPLKYIKVYTLMVDGYTQREIASCLGVTERTIHNYMNKICDVLSRDEELRSLYKNYSRY